ncbi:MAG TPA: uridine kinase [Candidatus Nitrosotenuis sp.]|jgi:uridine kinase|nr:uridine kinase [Candidatus Nitrosotenuis sp.]
MPSGATSANGQTPRLVIGLAGGTGSGKTTVARKLQEIFPGHQLQVIPQDAYYKDQSHLTFEERLKTNYDHPDAFDNDLLARHLDLLLAGQSVPQPVYSFITHTRTPETVLVHPAQILVVEGILVLADARLRRRMDIKVFVDTDPDVRILRRLVRDIAERGRTVESVIDQYLSVVRPMHLQFVEPTRRHADVIIPEGGGNDVAVDLLVVKIRSILHQAEVKR